jgi:hypothetical protein
LLSAADPRPSVRRRKFSNSWIASISLGVKDQLLDC